MSKIALSGNASGTGTFSIVAPNSNTDRTLTLPDEAGTVLTSGGAIDVNASAPADSVAIDASGNVGIGTSSPADRLTVATTGGTFGVKPLGGSSVELNSNSAIKLKASANDCILDGAVNNLFQIAGTERMRIDSSGNLLVGKTAESLTNSGLQVLPGTNSYTGISNTRTDGNGFAAYINRQGSDGGVVEFRHGNVGEGNITISGTTVSFNGGHLARWSQLIDSSKDESIVKGTVLSNLDEMCEWKRVKFDYQHLVTEAVEAQDAIYETRTITESYDGNANVGDVIDWTYEGETVQATVIVEDNEQLNRTKVSDVEGDANVAGVFVNWDEDDDMNIAMTGDMVIRIAQGTTVQRGDLLMSAGDGTAKPQGDDIVRSKTIAKVTSTHVSHTYDDGSYLVPCVLMAC